MENHKAIVPCEYEKIKNSILDKIIEESLEGNFKTDIPFFLQISGAMATGKTSFVNELNLDNLVIISFENIARKMPEYKGPMSYVKLEIKARIVGYEIMRIALEKRYNIVFDHHGMDPPHLSLFANVKELGYNARMTWLTCDTQTAYQRIKDRGYPAYEIETVERNAETSLYYLEEYKKITNIVIKDFSN